MLPAKKSALHTWLLFKYCRWLFRRRFSRITLLGDDTALKSDNYPIVFLGNHHYWYDGLLETLMMTRYKLDYYLMMEEKNLRRFWFFRYCGVFGVDLDSPEERSKGLLHAVRLLKQPASRRALFIFPHGELSPYGAPTPRIQGGLSTLLKHGKAIAIPYVKLISMGAEELPHVYIYLGKPIIDASPEQIDSILKKMEQALEVHAQSQHLPILHRWQ